MCLDWALRGRWVRRVSLLSCLTKGKPEAAPTFSKQKGQPDSCSFRGTSGWLRPKPRSEKMPQSAFKHTLSPQPAAREEKQVRCGPNPRVGGWHLPARVPCSPTFNPDLAIPNGQFRRGADGPLEDKSQVQRKQGGPSSPSFAHNDYKVVRHHKYTYEPCKCQRRPLTYFGKQSFGSLIRNIPFWNTLAPYRWSEYELRIKETHPSGSPSSGRWKLA